MNACTALARTRASAVSGSWAARSKPAVHLVRDEVRGIEEEERVRVETLLNDTIKLLAKDAARTLGGNGKIFPHGDIFGAKLWWDFFNYWSFMCGHFFQGLYREDADVLEAALALGQRYYDLNTKAQAILESWALIKSERAKDESRTKNYVPLPMFPSVLATQHLALQEKLSAADALAKMERDLTTGEALVTEVLAHALRDCGEEDAARLGQLVEERWSASLDALALPTGARFEADALPRRERLASLPDIGRDLERALGRKSASSPLSALWSRARGVVPSPSAERSDATL